MKKKYLLYVEDELAQANLFAHILRGEIKEYDYGIITLSKGEELLNFLSGEKELSVDRDQIGLILLDLSMHDISGMQILKNIKRYELEIPIAIFSAREDKETIAQTAKLGAEEYFVKGKDLYELQRLKKFIVKKMKSY
jgi:CheY-like chemotaxis protein